MDRGGVYMSEACLFIYSQLRFRKIYEFKAGLP
jgi:hypothetical protein